ncbi:hypothetical protein N9N67_04855 [Bacteriovoracaceae bacterium]|nr:hypothetical protein [Bacteriovoracaceae bacterium]
MKINHLIMSLIIFTQVGLLWSQENGICPFSVTKNISPDSQFETIPLDIILVIDNSNSMKDEQEKLASQFEGFLESLDSIKTDFNIAIITSSVRRDGTNEEQVINNGQFRSRGMLNSKAFRENKSRFSRRALNQIMDAGVDGWNSEKLFQSTIRFLKEDQSLNNRTRFLRSNSKLVLFFLSDIDSREASKFENSTFLNELISYKSKKNTLIYGALPKESEFFDDYENLLADPDIEGEFMSIHDDNFGVGLEKISTNIKTNTPEKVSFDLIHEQINLNSIKIAYTVNNFEKFIIKAENTKLDFDNKKLEVSIMAKEKGELILSYEYFCPISELIPEEEVEIEDDYLKMLKEEEEKSTQDKLLSDEIEVLLKRIESYDHPLVKEKDVLEIRTSNLLKKLLRHEKILFIVDTSGSMAVSMNSNAVVSPFKVVQQQLISLLHYFNQVAIQSELIAHKSFNIMSEKYSMHSEDDTKITRFSEFAVGIDQESIIQAHNHLSSLDIGGSHSKFNKTLEENFYEYDCVVIISDSELISTSTTYQLANRMKPHQIPIYSIIPRHDFRGSNSKGYVKPVLTNVKLELVKYELIKIILNQFPNKSERRKLIENEKIRRKDFVVEEFNPYRDALELSLEMDLLEVNTKIDKLNSILNDSYVPDPTGAIQIQFSSTLEDVSIITGGDYVYLPADDPSFFDISNIESEPPTIIIQEGLDEDINRLYQKINLRLELEKE